MSVPDSPRNPAPRRRFLQGFAAGAVAVGTPASARAAASSGALNVREAPFNAVGNGGQDDSDAFNAWFDALERSGLPGLLPAGRYLVPRLSAHSTSKPLVIIGNGAEATILDAGQSAPANFISLGDSLAVTGVTFEGFENVFVVTDGTALGYDQNGSEDFRRRVMMRDIDLLKITDCAFFECRRPLIGFVSDPLRIRETVITGNRVARAWAGFYLHVQNLDDLRIADNHIVEIDGSDAGYTPRGNPVRAGSSAGIHLGADLAAKDMSGGRWILHRNIIRRVKDRRRRGPDETPEVSGIHVWGSQWIDIAHNVIDDVDSAVHENCEGIYAKIRHARIAHNTMINAGRVEAFIMMKGHTPDKTNDRSSFGYAITCSHNQLWTDRDNTFGIGISVDRVDCFQNHLEGFNPTNPSFGPLFVTTHRLNNIRIAQNTIRASRARVGISCRNYGRGLLVEGNVIDGVDASGISTNENACGILVRNSAPDAGPVTDAIIRDNRIRDIRRPSHKEARAIAIEADRAPIERILVAGNSIETPVSDAIAVRGPVSELRLIGNDLRRSRQATYAPLASIPGFEARDNAGLGRAEIEWEPATVPAGRSLARSADLPGARPGDAISLRTRAPLRGLLAQARIDADDRVEIVVANLTDADTPLEALVWTVEIEKGGVS